MRFRKSRDEGVKSDFAAWSDAIEARDLDKSRAKATFAAEFSAVSWFGKCLGDRANRPGERGSAGMPRPTKRTLPNFPIAA